MSARFHGATPELPPCPITVRPGDPEPEIRRARAIYYLASGAMGHHGVAMGAIAARNITEPERWRVARHMTSLTLGTTAEAGSRLLEAADRLPPGPARDSVMAAARHLARAGETLAAFARLCHREATGGAQEGGGDG